MCCRRRTYRAILVDVDADVFALEAGHEHVVLEVRGQHLAARHVVLEN